MLAGVVAMVGGSVVYVRVRAQGWGGGDAGPATCLSASNVRSQQLGQHNVFKQSIKSCYNEAPTRSPKGNPTRAQGPHSMFHVVVTDSFCIGRTPQRGNVTASLLPVVLLPEISEALPTLL